MAPCDIPTMANSRESKSALARLYSAGISLRLVRSPPAPKMTITQGSAGRAVRLVCGATRVSAWAMNVSSSKKRYASLCSFFLGNACFYVSAEFLAHGGEHLLRESVLLSRTEASEKRCRKHIDRDSFIDRRLNRPPPFSGVLNKSRVLRERGIFRQCHRREIKQP